MRLPAFLSELFDCLLWLWTGGWWPWQTARWVVMAIDPYNPSTPPWRVYSGGVAYGMEYDSGAFDDYESACRFRDYRQYEAGAYTDYVYYLQREGAV